MISRSTKVLALICSSFCWSTALSLSSSNNNDSNNGNVQCSLELVNKKDYEYVCEVVLEGVAWVPKITTMTTDSPSRSPFTETPTPIVAKGTDPHLARANATHSHKTHSLQNCQGDCAKDQDCAFGLICLRRTGRERVPGCKGRGVRGVNYCYVPSPGTLVIMGNNKNNHTMNTNENVTKYYPYGKCQGQCKSHADCAAGLQCYERTNNETVPGCNGLGEHGLNYCFDPNNTTTVAPKTAADTSFTESPTFQSTPAPTKKIPTTGPSTKPSLFPKRTTPAHKVSRPSEPASMTPSQQTTHSPVELAHSQSPSHFQRAEHATMTPSDASMTKQKQKITRMPVTIQKKKLTRMPVTLLTSNAPKEVASKAPNNIQRVTIEPTQTLSNAPSMVATDATSYAPTKAPSILARSPTPSAARTTDPSLASLIVPSVHPSLAPSKHAQGVVPKTVAHKHHSGVPSHPTSDAPINEVSGVPSALPSHGPTDAPGVAHLGAPTDLPSMTPFNLPTAAPSGGMLSHLPSTTPSNDASDQPSTVSPTTVFAKNVKVSADPTMVPSTSFGQESFIVTNFPTNTVSTTARSSNLPSFKPSIVPSDKPTMVPSNLPSLTPSDAPSNLPSMAPSHLPSLTPSDAPSLTPSGTPSFVPSETPSAVPSRLPTGFSGGKLSDYPSKVPSNEPSSTFGRAGQGVIDIPSTFPNAKYALASNVPSDAPGMTSRTQPDKKVEVSATPTSAPSSSFAQQGFIVTNFPTNTESTTAHSRTNLPSIKPSNVPSDKPNMVQPNLPSIKPSNAPSDRPSTAPSHVPSLPLSNAPNIVPIHTPSEVPSRRPLVFGGEKLSDYPSTVPSNEPSSLFGKSRQDVTGIPSAIPNAKYALASNVPSDAPGMTSRTQSDVPSMAPFQLPGLTHSDAPSFVPSNSPSVVPSRLSRLSKVIGGNKVSDYPSSLPSEEPSSTFGQAGQGVSHIPSTFPNAKYALASNAPSTTQSKTNLAQSDAPSETPKMTPSDVPNMSPPDSSSVLPRDTPSTISSRIPTVIGGKHISDYPSVTPSIEPSTTFGQSGRDVSDIPSTFPNAMYALTSNAPSDVPRNVLSDLPSAIPSSTTGSKTCTGGNDPHFCGASLDRVGICHRHEVFGPISLCVSSSYLKMYLQYNSNTCGVCAKIAPKTTVSSDSPSLVPSQLLSSYAPSIAGTEFSFTCPGHIADYACGHRNNRVHVCQNETTICVGPKMVGYYLSKGGKCGKCTSSGLPSLAPSVQASLSSHVSSGIPSVLSNESSFTAIPLILSNAPSAKGYNKGLSFPPSLIPSHESSIASSAKPTAITSRGISHHPSAVPSTRPGNATYIAACNMSSDERLQSIRDELASISDRVLLDNAQSSQFEALKWVTLLDTATLCPGNGRLLQRYILALLYFQLTGDNWTTCSRIASTNCDASRFLSSDNECNWGGIQCDIHGNVIGLHLDHQNLFGSLPTELGDLHYLNEINMDSNKLNGSIPPSLGKLEFLEYIDIDKNNLTGVLPIELFNATTLRVLDLDTNNFVGTIPTNIGLLTNLYYLQLDFNQMTGSIPSALGTLPGLQYLSMFKNHFTSQLPLTLCGQAGIQLYADCDLCPTNSCCTACLLPDGATR
jgi:hypothetical protein